ncbi:NnrU family protein [Nostoc sp. NIES-2111]
MTSFLLALAAFLVAHLLPAWPPVRARLVALLGRRGYLVAYSLVSLALLAWLIQSAVTADDVQLWAPAAWQWWVPLVAMPAAGFLLTAGLIEANPLSVSLRAGDGLPAVACITRHPVLWGFLIWAASHVPPNGRLVPVLLFGAMAALSGAGFVLVDRKARRRLGEERWRALAAGSSTLPFAAMLAGQARCGRWKALALSAALAAALYAWFLLGGHALLIGPDPLAGLHALTG